MVAVADQAPFLDGQRRVVDRAASISARISGQSSRAASSWLSRFDVRAVSRALSLGRIARVLARATRSRGVARPVPTRAANRSRSYDWPSKLLHIAAQGRVVEQLFDGVEPLGDQLGRSQRATSAIRTAAAPPSASPSSRSRESSEPSRFPSRKVRTSSRLRRVISSSASVSARR